MRQEEELSETLLDTAEPDDHNIGKPDVDDEGTAHALMAALEEARYGDQSEHCEACSSRDYATYAMELVQRIRP